MPGAARCGEHQPAAGAFLMVGVLYMHVVQLHCRIVGCRRQFGSIAGSQPEAACTCAPLAGLQCQSLRHRPASSTADAGFRGSWRCRSDCMRRQSSAVVRKALLCRAGQAAHVRFWKHAAPSLFSQPCPCPPVGSVTIGCMPGGAARLNGVCSPPSTRCHARAAPLCASTTPAHRHLFKIRLWHGAFFEPRRVLTRHWCCGGVDDGVLHAGRTVSGTPWQAAS